MNLEGYEKRIVEKYLDFLDLILLWEEDNDITMDIFKYHIEFDEWLYYVP